MTDVITELEQVGVLVEKILRDDERARNDDKWLIYKVMRQYTNIFIPFEDFAKLPAFGTITRQRRMIQNKQGKYLPTIPEIIQKRHIREELVKAWAVQNGR